MGDHNGKVGIEQKIYILPQNREKKNFVFLASSEHKVFFSLFCGKKYTYLVKIRWIESLSVSDSFWSSTNNSNFRNICLTHYRVWIIIFPSTCLHVNKYISCQKREISIFLATKQGKRLFNRACKDQKKLKK